MPPQQLYSSSSQYIANKNYTPDEIRKFQEMQQQLQMQQQMQQYPVLTPLQIEEKKQEMIKYYSIINTQLQNILNTENKNNIDPFQLLSTISSSNDLTKEQMKNFFKHLLFYTYRASASEISNHLEVNKQLEEIKQVLLKLAPPTPTG